MKYISLATQLPNIMVDSDYYYVITDQYNIEGNWPFKRSLVEQSEARNCNSNVRAYYIIVASTQTMTRAPCFSNNLFARILGLIFDVVCLSCVIV